MSILKNSLAAASVWRVTYKQTHQDPGYANEIFRLFTSYKTDFNERKFTTYIEVANWLRDHSIIRSSTRDYLCEPWPIDKFTLVLNNKEIEVIKKNEDGFFYIDVDILYEVYDIKDEAPIEKEVELVSLL